VDKAHRSAVCTSTLTELADGSFLLIDPGLPYALMEETVYNRRGIKLDKISAIFITHFHGDHFVDIDKYTGAAVYASKEEIDLNAGAVPVKVEALDNQIDGIKVVPLPGHTMGTAGIAFKSGAHRVLVMGDAAMSKDFFNAGEGYFNAIDPEASKKSIDYAREHFDVIIPGHDVQFFISNGNI
jgi:glyoxylase-like metal-dependent hydrolase (beta-lactamase superfamily II)